MEGKTDGDRLTIASSILVWVANPSDRQGNEKLVMEWRGRGWEGDLDRASLARE